MLYQQYDFNPYATLNFDRDTSKYFHGGVRGQGRTSSPLVHTRRCRHEPWELSANIVAYQLKVSYNIDRSEIETILDNFENTYTVAEDLY